MDLATSLSHSLWDTIVPLALTAALAWLTKAILPVLHAIAAKAHLSVSSAEDAQVQYLVEKWVRYAESVVEAKYKGNIDATINKGEEKLQLALQGITKDVPYLSQDEARVLVEFVLNQAGLGAAKGVSFLAQKLQPATVVVNPAPAAQ